MVGSVRRRRIVTAADPAALRLRLYPGMAATQARALFADLVVHDADPRGDAHGLDALALWALRRYAPIVAADPPDGLVLDVTGATHRHGGDQGLLDDLIRQCEGAGLHARAGLGDTWGAAHALARRAADPTALAPSGSGGRSVAHLPVRALRLDAATEAALVRLGIETIEEVERMPRAALALRFGPAITRRLDQTYGRQAEPIIPVESPDLIQAEQAFADPIGAPETLARYTVKLVEQLCVALEARGLGARRLDLLFHRVDSRLEAVRVRAARPVRDVRRLSRLLCDRIERIDPGLGVERMVLTASLAEPLDWTAAPSDLTVPAVQDITDLVDVLANRIGAQRLYRLAPAQSDVPERSVRRIAPTAPPVGGDWPARWPRPSRLLRRPEPIETLAVLPDQPPVAFTWRGRRRRVRRADGPERIFGEWWRRDGEVEAVRDYFQVEDEAGERFWIFRRGDGEQSATGDLTWYLHGLFG
jgi:protein ImuB